MTFRYALLMILLVFLLMNSISAHIAQQDLKMEACMRAFKAAIPSTYTINNARKLTSRINNNYPQWYSYLPCCPCKESELKEEMAYWDPDSNPCLKGFHIGANRCYRSAYKYRSSRFASSEYANNHGQQCCYDEYGNLRIKGPAAGTPDFVSPKAELSTYLDGSPMPIVSSFISNQFGLGHWWADVVPWFNLPLSENHATWPPNQGCNQPVRVLVYGQLDWNDTEINVRKGDRIIFSDGRGTVQWGQEGSTSGPDGSKHIAESVLGLLLAPPKLETAPTGSLIGMVYIGKVPTPGIGTFELNPDYASRPFPIGSSSQITIQINGRLFLGVNDGYPENNSGYFDIAIRRQRAGTCTNVY